MIKVKVCASTGIVTFTDQCRMYKETEIRLGDSELINSRHIEEPDILQNKTEYQPETSHKDWKTICGVGARSLCADKIEKKSIFALQTIPVDIRKSPLFSKPER